VRSNRLNGKPDGKGEKKAGSRGADETEQGPRQQKSEGGRVSQEFESSKTIMTDKVETGKVSTTPNGSLGKTLD